MQGVVIRLYVLWEKLSEKSLLLLLLLISTSTDVYYCTASAAQMRL